MKRDVFRFAFFNEDTDILTTYTFVAIPSTLTGELMLHQIEYGDGELNGKFEDMWSETEMDYGVHDTSWSDGEIYGFTTYEVKPDKYLEVMNKWRDWFTANGFQCADIVKESEEAQGNDD